jgi:hypothetical protein
MKKITVIETDSNEIEGLLHKYYGITYEIVAAEELSNRSTLNFDVEPKLDDEDDVNDILSGKWIAWCTNDLMNKLCLDGHIEAGNYIIDCSW